MTISAGMIEPGQAFSVRDQVVIVTGGGQGLGREHARQFAARGAITIVAEFNADRGRQVVEEILSAGGVARFVHTDVGDEQSVAALVDATATEFGGIDIVINNAAICASLTMRASDQMPLDEWDQVLRTNLTGSFLMARAVIPYMKQRGWGRITNTASGSVSLGSPNALHYVSSKAAIIGMTNALARELGSFGITVNAIQPGVTFTEVPRISSTAEGKAKTVSSQCIPREGRPTDLVGLVLFLASEAAGFITGQTIACDGGLTH